MLDYRKCRKDGEPQVVHVNVEAANDEPEITFLAKSFEELICGLVNKEELE